MQLTGVAPLLWWLALAAFVICIALSASALLIRAYGQRRRIASERASARLAGEISSLLCDPDGAGETGLRQLLPALPAVREACGRLTADEQRLLRGRLARIGAARPLELRTRSERNRWHRIETVSLLGWLGDVDSIPVLREVLDDGEPELAYFAGQALASFDDGAAYDALLGALRAGRLPRARVAALLEGSTYRAAREALIARAEDPDAQVRFWIAYLVARAPGGGLAMPALTLLAEDEDFNVRANAAEALGRVGAPIEGMLERLCADDEWVVRAHAARAAGDAGLESLAPRLAGLLSDRHFWVRHNAATALERLGPASVDHVLPLLDGPDRFASNNAARILLDLGLGEELAHVLAQARLRADGG